MPWCATRARCAFRAPILPLALAASVGVSGPARAQQGPQIERVHPTSGPPGTRIEITGRWFGPAAEVWLGEAQLPLLRSLPHRLSARLGTGLSGGSLRVRTPFGQAEGPAFRVLPPPARPEIRSLSPRRAPPGAVVRIEGRNFSPRLSSNQVRFADQDLIVLRGMPDWLEVVAPSAVARERIRVLVAGAGSADSPQLFEALPLTRIDAIVPASAEPGARVRLRGIGLGARPAQVKVTLGGQRVPLLQARDTELLVALPKSAVSGHFAVEASGRGKARSTQLFVVRREPLIERFEPSAATPGHTVVLHGQHFGQTPAAIEVRLGERRLRVLEVRPTRLLARIPQGVESRPLWLKVHGLGPAVSREVLRILPRLRLDALEPREASVGSVVILSGQGFSPKASENRVTLMGTPVQVLDASPSQLRLRVPGARSGPLLVQVAASGSAQTRVPLIVKKPPEITGFEPAEADAGAVVTIRGRRFGDDPTLVRVHLEQVPLQVLKVDGRELLVRIPAGATTGKLRVSVPLQGEAVSTETLTVRHQVLSNPFRR